MSRIKIPIEEKAKSITISLLPKHQRMLDFLETKYKRNKSYVIQALIYEKYNQLGGGHA